jgi:Heterokaryon incompatibility protein (HET)
MISLLLGSPGDLQSRTWEVIPHSIEHTSCWKAAETITPSCPHPKTPPLPSRVIDVGTTGDKGKVKLHIASLVERQDYTALSYCWGGPQPVLLTTENLPRMRENIPFDSLPNTIQDAIKVTRGLGIQFLWIDALCIIQEGDDEDKLREIGVVGRLYKNATVTIFAASAKSVSEGFLQPRPTHASHLLPLACPDGRQGIAQLILNATHNPMNPLNTRGWTLQESLLSPRKLIYGEKELVWDCEMELEFPTSFFDLSWSFHLPRETFEPNSRLSIPKAHEIWGSVVYESTGRRLSFPEDRLAAVTGVTAELQSVCQDECIFGLWHNNFIRQLCWVRAGPPESASAALTEKGILHCAPEWSWASRQFQTSFRDVEPEEEQCWELRDNTVVLSRKLRRGYDIPTGQRKEWDFTLDIMELAGVSFTPHFLLDHEGKEVFYLLLGQSKYDLSAEWAMVLVPAEDEGRFRRIGLVQNGSGTSWFDDLEKREVILV